MPRRFVGEGAETAPGFFQQFSPQQYDDGRFINVETKEDLSDETFEGGSIRIEQGRPVLETSDNPSDTIIDKKASEEGSLVRTNLFKQKAGWKWTEAPEGEPSTIVSVEQGSKHFYTLDFTSSKPLTLKTYPDKKSEPRGRPTTRGKVQLGKIVGEIDIRGKKHPVYDQVTVGEPEVTAGAAPVGASTTENYNLLNSPFVGAYDGPGPQDTTIPDYSNLHYVVTKPQQNALNEAISSGAVDNLADQVAEEATEMLKNPNISSGLGWYSRMRARLKDIFGKDVYIFTHLLGTTSAQTPVELNFRYSVDLYNRFKSGEFDSQIKKYLELKGRLQDGTLGDLLIREQVKNAQGKAYTKELVEKSKGSSLLQQAARHYKLLPRQKTGKLYGANSYPALKALSQVWFDERLGKNRMTPKTP